MTRTSLLLTALLVVGAATAGLSGAVASNAPTSDAESTQQESNAGAYQQGDDELADAAVDSGDVFWQGQFLEFTAGADNASEVWAVRELEDGDVGGLVTEVLLAGNGSAVVGTSGLDGRFVVVDEQDRPVVFENGDAQRVGDASEASFEIAAQSLNASFEDDIVRNDDHPDARTDLRLESNRAGYRVSLFSEELNASELADAFSAARAGDDRAVVERNVSGDDLLRANFSGVEPGTYEVTVAAADGTAEDTAAITVTEPMAGEAGLDDESPVENRGDVVRFNVTFDGTDEATVDLGSADVGYHSRFTVVDGDEDGEATVEFDTYRAGQSGDAPGVSAAGEDNVTDFQLLTDPIPGRLDAAGYPVAVSVGTQRTAVGLIELTERETGGIQTWTAPESASVRSVSQLTDVATRDDRIADQDWAIVGVEASGLYAYVENVSDLNDNETGLSTSLTRGAEPNVPSEEVDLDRADLLVDEDDDRFFLVLNANALEQGATYEANFTVSDANPYVEEGNATSLTTNFSVVERNVTFDEPVEVPASSDAAVSGASSVAAGTDLAVELSNTQDAPFLRRGTATVGEDGTWEVTVDLSDVQPGTNFTVDVADPEANASGVVVETDGAAADADGTETTEAGDGGTTADADEETTTADEDEDVGDEETTAADDEADAGVGDEDGETTAADAGADLGEGDTTTAAETPDEGDDAADGDEGAADEDATTTDDALAASAPAPGFGPAAVVGALAVLLAVGMLAARRH
ncbi:DUF7827 domain-containing protein [Halorussus halobius]|uniref:DUF7827 domain-containing protein n=1 Tax=Halorussus halobius TaxID=1710537 RepID=UPI00143D7D23|nr:BGTF surface domain-containing protein [Halorussus halobius]